MKSLWNKQKSFFERHKEQQSKLNLLSPEKLTRLTADHPELRLGDDLAVMQLIEMAKRNPQDADIQEFLNQKIAAAQQAYEASGDPFWGNIPTPEQWQRPTNFVKIGRISTGIDTGLDYNQLPFTHLILGPTGLGKSTTLKAIVSDPALLRSICIVILVKKPEWRGFLSLPQLAGLVRIFPLKDLAISFAQPSDGVPLVIWHNDITKFTGQNYERLSAHRLMSEALRDLAARFPSGRFASLSQVVAEIEASKAHPFSRRADLKDSIVSCLKDLQLSVGNIFEYSYSDFLENLFSHSGLNVIEAMTLPPEHLSFLTTYLTRWIYTRRLYGGPGRTVLLVIDDATVNVCQAKDRSNPGGIAPIPEAIIMCRALNIGFFLSVHNYSGTSEIIRQNLQTLIIKGLPGEDVYVLKNLLGFTNEQIAMVKDHLPKEKAVFINRGQWPKPVLIQIDKPNIPETCPDALMEQTARDFLNQVTTIPPYPVVSTAMPTPMAPAAAPPIPSGSAPIPVLPALNAKEVNVLMWAAKLPPLPLSHIYRQAGLSNSEGVRVIKKLTSSGLLVSHVLSTGRRGGKVQLMEVTAAGWSILEHQGYRKPKEVGQGSWLHKAAALWIGEEGKAQREKVTFEVVLEGCRMDVMRINSATHHRTFYNIGLTTPGFEAAAVIKFFAASAAKDAQFVLVTETQAFADKVSECLKQTAEGSNVINLFTTKLIGSFVKV